MDVRRSSEQIVEKREKGGRGRSIEEEENLIRLD
jgi:hypothetical protein